MDFRGYLIVSIVLCSSSYLVLGVGNEIVLLQKTLDALWRGLNYMEEYASEINLDGAFGCRLVEELFDGFLRSNPEVFNRLGGNVQTQLQHLMAKSERIVAVSRKFININSPKYYSVVGGLLDKGVVPFWYPSRFTTPYLQIQPLPCAESVFNESRSDNCLQELLGKRSGNGNISKDCVDMMTKPKLRGYALTHQVLYFELAELHGTMGKKEKLRTVSVLLQDSLCSNVKRDAQEIADANYPVHHQDLFMEQIGLCGLWGFQDFYKEEWLKQILNWQKYSGCYADRAKWRCIENLREENSRVKREEKILMDGCLSHKTAVAVLALAANVRFLIENVANAL